MNVLNLLPVKRFLRPPLTMLSAVAGNQKIRDFRTRLRTWQQQLLILNYLSNLNLDA